VVYYRDLALKGIAIARARAAGKSKVFYTSLGFPPDFKTSQFITLLVNAIKWAMVSGATIGNVIFLAFFIKRLQFMNL
jgi:hypothetical protein